jgi:hypothetical protein
MAQPYNPGETRTTLVSPANENGGHKARPYESKTAQREAGPFLN